MRAAPGVIFLAAAYLAGCGSEPTFDERYVAAEDKIRSKAASIDSELSAAERTPQPAGAAADRVAARPSSPQQIE